MPVQTSFLASTSTNYQTALDDMVAFVTGDQVASVAINAQGTGYAVDDIITLSGGTSLAAATFKVTGVTAGAIDTLIVWNAGSYSVNTGLSAVATTGGNADATVDVTYQTPWTLERIITNEGAVNAVIVNPGTGYAVSDTLTGVGGTGTKYTLNVDSETGGVIDAVSIVTNGDYTALPTNPDTVTGGTGSSATFTMTFSGSDTGNDEREVLLKGIGSGSDEIFVGIRTYEDGGANAQNWELAGMTGHNLTAPYVNQPNLSPGRFNELVGGAYVPLATNTITWWLNMSGRRIIFNSKVSTSYSSMYLGFYTQFGTAAEIPYPIIVAGGAGQPDTRFSSLRGSFTSIAYPVGKASAVSVSNDGDIDDGPIMIRNLAGNWVSVMVAYEVVSSTSDITSFIIRTLSPPGRASANTNLPAENDSWLATPATTVEWDDFVLLNETGTPTNEIRATPDSGGDKTALFPQTIFEIGSSVAPGIGEVVFGELDGVKWAAIAGSSIVAEDTVTQDGIVHRIFQGGNKTEPYHFFGVEER